MCKQQKYLEFLLIKSLEQVLGDDLIEALLQSQELGLDASQKTPVDVKPDVLFLGVLGDGNALTIWLELMLDDLSVGIVFNAEGVVQHTCDVVVPVERETFEFLFEGFCTHTVGINTDFFYSNKTLESTLVSLNHQPKMDVKLK